MKSDQAIGKMKMDRALEALGGDIARLTESVDQVITEIPGLILFRKENITAPTVGMYEPSICVMAQGQNVSSLGMTPLSITPNTIWLPPLIFPLLFRLSMLAGRNHALDSY